MAVAHKQIQELLDIIIEEIGPDGPEKFHNILVRFENTTAYRVNDSFATTVDRFLNALPRYT